LSRDDPGAAWRLDFTLAGVFKLGSRLANVRELRAHMEEETEPRIERLLDTPDLAGALESDRFKHFLDHIPVAIAVAEIEPAEHVVYVNLEFERLTGRAAADIEGKPWTFLPGQAAEPSDDRRLGEAVAEEQDYLGVFDISGEGERVQVDAWSNEILDETGRPVFRLIALARTHGCGELAEMGRQLAEKDAMLRELQHRVRNNLQMITALVRLEARNLGDAAGGAGFARIAGRVEALGLLYSSLEARGDGETVDLGAYVSQIAASVMGAHATEGIHLDLQADAMPVPVNVAMPTGLAVNELITNALKHAFTDREGGVVRVECAADETGLRVVVADDGAGLPDGVSWPQAGKISAMIVHALRENAGGAVDIQSAPDAGVRVTLTFPRDRNTAA
jgi:PAS domain S-box-containing protein